MSEALNRLIVEAMVLGGAAHPCCVLGHRWVFKGGAGRERPNGGWYSVPVYECSACGDCDYGDNDEAREIAQQVADEDTPDDR